MKKKPRIKTFAKSQLWNPQVIAGIEKVYKQAGATTVCGYIHDVVEKQVEKDLEKYNK